MLSFLKHHPFAVRAFFDYSAVLTYALPAPVLRALLPPGLSLDEKNGMGFLAVAMVKTRNLRPAIMPPLLGQDFFLVGYRIFTRYKTNEGRHLRGLYILRSETDRRFMTFSGNLLTHYHYHTMDITAEKDDNRIRVTCPGSLEVTFHKERDPQLPAGSVFQGWREARMFAGPMPFTFNLDVQTRSMILIEGVRGEWKPEPARAVVNQCAFLSAEPLRSASPILSSAFVVENIPYLWKRGRVERIREG